MKWKIYEKAFARIAMVQSVTYCEKNPHLNKSLFTAPKSHGKLRSNELELLASHHTKWACVNFFSKNQSRALETRRLSFH